MAPVCIRCDKSALRVRGQQAENRRRRKNRPGVKVRLFVGVGEIQTDGGDHALPFDILLAVMLVEGSVVGMTFSPERAAHLRWR